MTDFRQLPGTGDEYFILDDPDKQPRRLTVHSIEKKPFGFFGTGVLHILSFEETEERVLWETTHFAQAAHREKYRNSS